jgi:hypothetical protein
MKKTPYHDSDGQAVAGAAIALRKRGYGFFCDKFNPTNIS